MWQKIVKIKYASVGCSTVLLLALAFAARADEVTTPASESEKEIPSSAPVEGSSAASPAKTKAEERAGQSETVEQPLHEPVIIEESPTKVIIPPGRPDWVEALPVRVGQVHSTAVSSGPYARQQEAARALDTELVMKTREYIVEHLGSEMAGQLIRYDAKRIKTELVKPANIYREEIVVSIGPMQQLHALLEFGPEFRAEIDRQWARIIGTSRLLQMALLVGGVLGLLATVSGYFRLDNATRGYYTGRLQALAAIAILAVIGSGIYFARIIPWL